MKVNPFSSLGAKLFYLMSGLTLTAVGGISWQTSNTFREFLTRQIQDSTLLQSEGAASEVSNVIDNWIGQVAVALPTLRGINKKDSEPSLQNFVQSSGDFVALQMYLADGSNPKTLVPIGAAFTKTVADPRLEEKDPAKVFSLIRVRTLPWLASRVASATKTRVLVQNITPLTKLAMANIAIRFEVAGSRQTMWAVLTVWQTKILSALPKTRFMEGSLIDRNGRIFASPILDEMNNAALVSEVPIAQLALEGRSPSAFRGEYRGKGGRNWLGAYTRIPKHDGLSLLIQRDADQAYLIIKKNLTESAIVACLFVLVAVALSYFVALGITRSLREVTTATGRIAAGDFAYRITPSSKDEVGALSFAVNSMSEQIVGLLKSQVDKARFEKELETAKMVQSTFFPKNDITTGSMHVTGHYLPASECGGDLWGHFTIREGLEFVFIADAMGHGAPAALVTAMAYSTCMTISDILKDTTVFNHSPGKILDRLNRIIFEAVRGEISMTFFASLMDFKTGEMICANAGHNFPIVLPARPDDPRCGKASASMQKISNIVPISLSLKGVPLGIDPNAKFAEKKYKLEPGDKIVYFTDGLIECSAPNGSVWGRKTFVEETLMLAGTNAHELRDRLLDRAFQFFSGNPIADDVTLVVAEIDQAWRPSQVAPAGTTTADTSGTTGADAKFKVSLPSVG